MKNKRDGENRKHKSRKNDASCKEQMYRRKKVEGARLWKQTRGVDDQLASSLADELREFQCGTDGRTNKEIKPFFLVLDCASTRTHVLLTMTHNARRNKRERASKGERTCWKNYDKFESPAKCMRKCRKLGRARSMYTTISKRVWERKAV